jgi:hypothetical protein
LVRSSSLTIVPGTGIAGSLIFGNYGIERGIVDHIQVANDSKFNFIRIQTKPQSGREFYSCRRH